MVSVFGRESFLKVTLKTLLPVFKKSFVLVNRLVDFCDASYDGVSNHLSPHLSSHNVHKSKAFLRCGLVAYGLLACRNEQRKHRIDHKHTVFRTCVSSGYDLPAVAELQNSYHIHYINVLPSRCAYLHDLTVLVEMSTLLDNAGT